MDKNEIKLIENFSSQNANNSVENIFDVAFRFKKCEAMCFKKNITDQKEIIETFKAFEKLFHIAIANSLKKNKDKLFIKITRERLNAWHNSHIGKTYEVLAIILLDGWPSYLVKSENDGTQNGFRSPIFYKLKIIWLKDGIKSTNEFFDIKGIDMVRNLSCEMLP
jgi:hypothetical protein